MIRFCCMNETIQLTPRQKAIVNILAESNELSRKQITEKLASIYPASKATLARDIKLLINKKQVQVHGSGPNQVYRSTTSHPLLKNVDLDQYFRVEPDKRQNIKTSFNFDIFTNLQDLIPADEQQELKIIFRSFSQTIKTLDSTIYERELERFMVELAWKSSKIEGNTYTLLETETLIKESQEAKGHPKAEALMILNHKDAFKTIIKHRNEFRKLSFDNISQLHNTLIKDLSISSGIRKHGVGITGTTYRPLDNEWQIREALEQLVELVNSTVHPLEKALITGSLLAYIQPFADGNKRTARMLSNAILLSFDLFPLSYRSIDENEYKSALILFFETNNLYHVKRLFLDQYKFALRTYFI